MILTVFFFIRTCKLMFLNHTIDVIIYSSTTYYAVLFAAIHCLCINVVTVFSILKKHSFAKHAFKILFSFFISLRRIMVEVVREIYLWFYYMIKRVGVAFGFYASFFLIQYIIRAACNTFYQFFFWTYSFKRF